VNLDRGASDLDNGHAATGFRRCSGTRSLLTQHRHLETHKGGKERLESQRASHHSGEVVEAPTQ